MFSKVDRVATKIRKFIESQLPDINDGVIDFISGFVRISIDDIYITMEFDDNHMELNTNYKNYGKLILNTNPKVLINSSFRSIPIDVMTKFIPDLAREYFEEVSIYKIENIDIGTITLTRSKYCRYKNEKIETLCKKFSLEKSYNLTFPWVELKGKLDEYEVSELENYLDQILIKYTITKEIDHIAVYNGELNIYRITLIIH